MKKLGIIGAMAVEVELGFAASNDIDPYGDGTGWN